MVIESMQNGKDYVLFYLKLLLESVDHEGALRFNDVIPYNENMLSAITNTNIDVVRSAMKLFVELKLIEIMSDETIYMKEIENMLGSETYWAKKKREQRDIGQFPIGVLQKSTMSKQEIEKDIELEIDIDNKSLCSKFKYSNEHMELAETLLSLIKQNNPNYKLTGSLDKWANEFRLMVERDKRTVEQIAAVMEWSQQDSFWQSNILSAGKLREKFDQLSLRMNQKNIQQRQPTQREINAEERRRIAEEYDRINSNQTY